MASQMKNYFLRQGWHNRRQVLAHLHGKVPPLMVMTRLIILIFSGELTYITTGINSQTD